MITLAPLPSWKAVLTALLARPQDPGQLAAPWVRSKDERAGWLSRSAWSLVLLAHWRSQHKGNGPVSVWIPDYFCGDSLALLRKINVRLHFYPVTEKLLPDYPRLREHAKTAAPDIVLLVHYFGMPAPASEAREFCKREGAWLVEDAAHVLLPMAGVGTEGDFIIYSPHKSLALPDGALLLARPAGPSKLGHEFIERLGSPGDWQCEAARLLPGAGAGRRLQLWTVKRCLQKLGIGRGTSGGQFDDMPGEPAFPPAAMSRFAQSLLGQHVHRLPDVALARKRNLLLLDHLLLHPGAREDLVPAARPGMTAAVPYQAGYRSAQARSWFARLRDNGLPATTWPDLPAEVRASPKEHSVAVQLRETTFFLPSHQSLSGRALLAAFPAVARHEALASAQATVQVQDFKGDRQAWQGLMQQAGFSNLLQSWSYGVCKERTGAWQVRRLLLLEQGRVVGFAQVLQRCLGKLLCVSRLNRGPVFLPGAGPATRLAALQSISRELGRWQRGRVLSWAPECRVEGASLAQLLQTRFLQLSIRGWSSSVIDLQQDEGQLRSGLAGSWRNMLNVAQRNALKVEQLDTDDRAFEALLSNCGAMMQARRIPFPADLYRELRKELDGEGCPGLLLALSNGEELIAAIYVVAHGNTATYLLGWSGDEGRKLHAHHLLLWENMVQLKARGLRYFDLGGIDERTSGIAAFKLGLGGERYQLAGEGWCC